MSATRATGRPSFGVALGAREQVVGAQLVAAAQADAQFQGDRRRRDPAGAGLGEERADQRGGDAVIEWHFSIGPSKQEGGYYRFETDTGQGEPGRREAARWAVYQTSGGARVASADSYPPLKRGNFASQWQRALSKTSAAPSLFQFSQHALLDALSNPRSDNIYSESTRGENN